MQTKYRGRMPGKNTEQALYVAQKVLDEGLVVTLLSPDKERAEEQIKLIYKNRPGLERVDVSCCQQAVAEALDKVKAEICNSDGLCPLDKVLVYEIIDQVKESK